MHRIHRILKKLPGSLYLLAVSRARILYGILWLFYNLSGARHIGEMAWPRKINDPEYRKPPTLLLWIIGLYAALYGIAETRYEAALDRVENRMGALASQLATGNKKAFKNLIAQIPRIQGMKTPPEPRLLWPSSVFASLLTEAKNPEIRKRTRETVEIWKESLAGMDFRGINLFGARLPGADLSGALLWNAEFSGARLRKADLSGAELWEADLSGAWLWEANLSGAWLRDIRNWREIEDIQDANILGVKDAPEGFRAWALERGAVELAPAEWAAFQESR